MSKYDSWTYWQRCMKNHAPSTVKAYRPKIKAFADWSGYTFDELFDFQEKAFKSRYDLNADPRDQRFMVNLVNDFLDILRKEGLPSKPKAERQPIKEATINLYKNAIRSFFARNEVPLEFPKDATANGQDNSSKGSRIPDRKEVLGLIESIKTKYGKPRFRWQALFMTLKDSGIRISDIPKLRYDTKTDLGNGFWSWEITTQKRKQPATVVIGPEATEMILQLPRTEGEERIFPYASKTMRNEIAAILRKYPKLTGHGFRKYHHAYLQPHIAEEHILRLEGKKTSPYSENRIHVLQQEYIECYDALRVHPQLATQGEVDALQLQVQELQSQLQEIQEARSATDGVMDALFGDEEFLAMFRKKIRELS